MPAYDPKHDIKLNSEKNKTSWPDAIIVVVLIVTIGWIIYSLSSCEARKMEAACKTNGTVIW